MESAEHYGMVMKDKKGYFKPDEIKKIIHASPYPYNLVFLVAWETGRRVSEIVKSEDVVNSTGIRRKDLNMKENAIYFTTLKMKLKDKFGNLKKPSGMWVTDVPRTLMEELWKLAENKEEDEILFRFEDYHNKRIIKNYRIQVTLVFRKICESIGIRTVGLYRKHPHMHHLRHSAIMFMYSKGFKPEEIVEKTGHKNINNVLWYIKVLEDENVSKKFKALAEEEDVWLKEVFNINHPKFVENWVFDIDDTKETGAKSEAKMDVKL